tara:strand:+ start:1614 stop:1739 length:126 start_codon:yes stop_codon:yes gene_type:complete
MRTYLEVIGGEFLIFHEKKFNITNDKLDLNDKIYLLKKLVF